LTCRCEWEGEKGVKGERVKAEMGRKVLQLELLTGSERPVFIFHLSFIEWTNEKWKMENKSF